MVSESFTPVPSQVGAARRFAMEAAEAIGCCPLDLALVVSELATNACVHGRSDFTVSLHRHESGLLVEVADDNPEPATLQPTATGPSGRGIAIVAAVAREWGSVKCGPGKSVWAVLGCP
jgi:anti-sigma regulatory factor (Ser/Thr protein kinase)